jgi:hypothetical protein
LIVSSADLESSGTFPESNPTNPTLQFDVRPFAQMRDAARRICGLIAEVLEFVGAGRWAPFGNGNP